ncbi:iron-siderophore ABC transporter substrate-binding protein [Pseudofrankia sp. BMG5.37]|uniref:iron-siderophore ABC transporter substrate-binding protein n=1 Tax=Pseudofrankia sp. BMG5.37 TaxID=3050035 RepID=UPI002894346C|nr:iron-siderophore ABC transporter substrate-binding protein [Pseudofrankia sp. BMG5.37]MDT3439505.1 iron-siderophore ABC transporter substrate-binding protein [Pseudofrankia sp. BMG5.37]
MRNRLKLIPAFFLAVIALALAAGCGGSDDGDGTPAPASAASGSFPVTLKDKFGTAVVPAEPTRIIALSYEEDTLAALGITPIAYGKNEYKPDGVFPWLTGKVDLSKSTALDTAGDLNLEQIAALKPDLILATNFYGLADYYDRLSKIAPTVGFTDDAGIATWQENSTIIGKAVGREADTAKAIAATGKIIKDTATGLPGLAGKTFSYSFYYEPGGLAVIDDPETVSVQLYSELGMKLAPGVTENVVDRSLSMEKLSALDADFVLIGYATPDLKTEMDSNKLFTEIPAVRAGRVLEVDAFTAGAVNNPTILNIPWQLEQLKPTLAKAAASS